MLYGEHVYRPKNRVQSKGLFKSLLILLLLFNELENVDANDEKKDQDDLSFKRDGRSEKLYRMYESIYFVRQKLEE